MNELLIDKIRGVIFGQAIADALGLGMEGMTKAEVQEFYPQGLYHYRDIIRDRHRSAWVVGDWTDDTDLMLCILDSLIEKKQLDILDIAVRFYQWAVVPHPGIGRQTYSVLFSRELSGRNFFQENFYQDYYLAAKAYWEESGGNAAANGGIMRTSVLGIWEYLQSDRVIENAEKVCKITHYDPRCVGSSVAISLLISYLLQGITETEEIMTIIQEKVNHYHPSIAEYFALSKQTNLEKLNLGEPDNKGYTLKTMCAGLWAFQYVQSYEEGILKIIHEGGDTDTNAAVAGAILGAKFGYNTIPTQWIEGLAYKDELNRKTQEFIKILTDFNK